MCDFEGDAVAVVAVSLKMCDILRATDGDVAARLRRRRQRSAERGGGRRRDDGDLVVRTGCVEDAGAGAETAETEPADDRDDRVARG